MTKPYTIREVSGRLQADIDYANYVLDGLKSMPQAKKPNVPTHFNGKLIKDLSYEEKEEFFLSMQPESTRKAIKRTNEERGEYWESPILGWKANPEAKSLDEAVGLRALDAKETILAEDNRRKSKNSLGDSKDSSVNKEKRQKGIEAFTYSRPAKLTAEETKRVTKLEEIVNTPLEPENANEDGFFSKLFKPFFGKGKTEEIKTKILSDNTGGFKRVREE